MPYSSTNTTNNTPSTTTTEELTTPPPTHFDSINQFITRVGQKVCIDGVQVDKREWGGGTDGGSIANNGQLHSKEYAHTRQSTTTLRLLPFLFSPHPPSNTHSFLLLLKVLLSSLPTSYLSIWVLAWEARARPSPGGVPPFLSLSSTE